jgi:hypothetical protein
MTVCTAGNLERLLYFLTAALPVQVHTVLAIFSMECDLVHRRDLEIGNSFSSPQQEDNYSHCNGQKNEDLGP